MKKQTLRISALFLALMMVLPLASCKKGSSDNSSSDVDIEYQYEYVDGTNSSSGSGDQAAQGSNDKTNPNGSSNKTTGTSNGDISKYKGKTVRYATWKDPDLNEDGPVIDEFEKKYGIKVQVDIIGQSEYVNTIVGNIAAGNAPDVFFCNFTFPAALACLQPIDAAELDLSDAIWDQGMLEQSKINGKSYLVNTVGNIWNEVDMVYYNKKLLKDNNITTPEEYYKAGKWTFETMKKVMTDVSALGPDYKGGYIDMQSLVGSTGAAYYRWNDGKFSNGMDTMLTDTLRFLAQCNKEGIYTAARDSFMDGKVGIAVTNAFGLKKTGYWSKMNTDLIGYTYMPDYDANNKAHTTGIYRGWGIIKGAKNPGAAGAFLRYYLDVNNYDTKSSFISPDAESFFFKLTNITSNQKNYYFEMGAAPVTGTTYDVFASVKDNDPTQIATVLSSLQNTIDSDVKKLNDFIAKVNG